MSYRALVFCPDEKTSRAVAKVLSELDFSIEPCSEPFAVVKRLATEHFDALLVDCDDEQNATLLFKSARNSASNHSSLAVALVEGQAGIAKAFRLGANLVLTKPINVEQAKGTLRVARGLLRKAQTAQSAASSESTEAYTAAPPENLDHSYSFAPAATPDPIFAAALPKVALPATPLASAALEIEEKEPAPELGAAEAALLESMPDPAPVQPSAESSLPASKTYAWQSTSASSELAPKIDAATVAPSGSLNSSPALGSASAPSIDETKPSLPSSSQSLSSEGAAAATAPAKEISPSTVKKAEPKKASAVSSATPAPKKLAKSKSASAGKTSAKSAPAAKDDPDFSWKDAAKDREAAEESNGTKNFAIAAVLVLGLAAAGYFAWPRLQPVIMSLPWVQKYLGPSQPQTVPTPAPAPSAAPPTTDGQPQPATEIPNATAPTGSSASLESAPAPSSSTQPAAETPSPQDTQAEPAQKVQKPIVVPSGGHASKPSAQLPSPPPIAPSDSSDKAIVGIVSTAAASAHKPVLQAVHLSQSASDGLVLKRVAPVYPSLALQMRVGGAVQLQANISKEGDITNLKVLRGDPLLTRAAVDAVRQWKYKPYMLDGQPVEVQTQVTIDFKLPH